MEHSELRKLAHFEECEIHGKYQTNRVEDGVVRWLAGCPACTKLQAQARLMRRASIPKRFQSKSFENFRATDQGEQNALSIAVEFAAEFSFVSEVGQCLIFVGPPGTGKTHLACAIANQIMLEGHSALFATVTELIRRIRATWSRDSDESEIEVINQLAKVDLLIIDEVGVQRGTKDEQMHLFEMINARYESVKPTIIISNLPVKSKDEHNLRAYLGDRAFDRLRENGGRLVQFLGDSKRGGSSA